MTILPLNDVKTRFSAIADEVAATHDRVIVTRNGRPHVMVISIDDFESLQMTRELLAEPGGGAMSTLRTAELTLASRANAYVALTKPDVSFLVLITTAAGYYMGARGPVNWLHLIHTVFGTMLIAAGTAALNRSGYLSAQYQVPSPPML